MKTRILPFLILGCTTVVLLRADDDQAKPKATATATPSPLFNIRGYGAIGDGKADDTKAIQACIDAAPEGDLVTIPRGKYRTTKPLVVKKTLAIVGVSGYAQSLGAYGDPDYGTGKLAWGSVLLYEGKTGAAIDHDAKRYTGLRLENLVIVGVGDGTRTSTGFRSVYQGGASVANLRNVTITSFKIGLDLDSVERSHLDDLYVFGCDTGVYCRLNTNANVFTNLNVGQCNDGVVFDKAVKNVVLGGTIQSSYRTGVLINRGAEENSLRDIYFENPGHALTAAGDSTTVDSCHFGGKGDGIVISGNGCRLLTNKYQKALKITGSGTQLVGGWPTNLSDRGMDTIMFGKSIRRRK